MRLHLDIQEIENGYVITDAGRSMGVKKTYVATNPEGLVEVILELATEASQTDDVKKFRESGI